MVLVKDAHTKSRERHKVPEQATILVIDDEESMRDSCCQVLAKDGYRTETAEDGSSGLRKIKETHPDLILVDIKMPGISGMELLEKVADIDPNVVSVVITGYATVESAVEAMKRNAYDYLPKPFSPDQLRIVTRRGLERRRLALESARLQQEKEMMKKNFITLVSHQLRAPLTCVKQCFGVIQEGFTGEVASKQKEMIEIVGKRIDGLIQLINDWLDMSRIEAGNLTEEFKPLDIVNVLLDTIDTLKPLAETKKVTLKTDFCDAGRLVQGDQESLKQAFTNLVTNAINYNRDGGTVGILTGSENNNVLVEISDTGIGISQENLPFIFDDFFRVKTKDTCGVAGSGLGLTIVKRIIEAHNGCIMVVSQLGEGTTFRILLPKAEQ
ncbi:MAG TPA: hybrid sensor histidine kinase/response regulator [Sedimentisphaerales bacterium]|nr:hybrid sensor histidine kinase/response regulator [Sedimentisphaerales bacterium]